MSIFRYVATVHGPGSQRVYEKCGRGKTEAILEIPAMPMPTFFKRSDLREWLNAMDLLEADALKAPAAVQGPFGANWVPPVQQPAWQCPTCTDPNPHIHNVQASGGIAQRGGKAAINGGSIGATGTTPSNVWLPTIQGPCGNCGCELKLHTVGQSLCPPSSNTTTSLTGAPEPIEEVLELDLSEVAGCTANPSCGLPDWRCTRCHKDNCPSAEKCWNCQERA